MNFIEELQWRGMIHGITPGAEALCKAGGVTGYAGFDPRPRRSTSAISFPSCCSSISSGPATSPSACMSGATGMIGDPSGKSEERNLLGLDVLRFNNQECIKAQLERFLDFTGAHGAELVNNYDWFKGIGFLDFLRDVGKHLTVNYMVAKDSVQGTVGQRHLIYRIQLPAAPGVRLPLALYK